ncbi:MAG: insulinase family protein [Coriobacteriia bacterium]|nr:insulinase family protein [Coriobacteriia bacterium]
MGFHRTELDNGITVVTEGFEGVRSIALGIWFNVGSRDEAAADAGMSHFMEHMMFKGTPTYSARELSEAFDRLGARQNAFTSKEVTCYYADFIDESLEGVFALLADMVTNASLEQEACELEREVIIEEIARAEDDPENVAHELFSSLAWPDSTLGLPIAGTKETVAGFDRERSLAFRKKHYYSDNCVVATAGNVEHAKIVALAQRFLDDLPIRGKQARRKAPGANSEVIKFKFKETEQTHLFTGQFTISARSDDRFALLLANNILGGSMSSRLFQEVREKQGLVYSIYSYPQLLSDGGLFAVYAGTRPENAQVVFEKIERERMRVGASDITADELERAKASVKGALALSLESTSRRMIRIAEATINEIEVLTFDEQLALYERTTLDDVHAVAQAATSAPQTTAIVGPYRGQGFDQFDEE